MPIFVSSLVELGGLIKFVRPFLAYLSKAKAAKMVRTLLDLFLDMETSTGREVVTDNSIVVLDFLCMRDENLMQVEICLECIEWAKHEKRTFLRQALEVRPVDCPSVCLASEKCWIAIRKLVISV